MKKEYDTFTDDLSTLKDGQESEIAVRDCETYETKVVKAIINSNPEKLPDGDTLWVRYQRGGKRPQPWAIKILEDKGTLLEKKMGEYSDKTH